MSNKTLDYPSFQNLKDFFQAVGKRNKWFDYDRGMGGIIDGGSVIHLSTAVKYVDKTQFLAYKKTHIRYDGSYSGLVVTIALIPHQCTPVYLVNRFEVSDTGSQQGTLQYLLTRTFFRHYNKIEAAPEDVTKKDIPEFWTIGSTANFEALMRAYDNCAKIYGYTTVFNLP
jgi:hypothetical protein